MAELALERFDSLMNCIYMMLESARLYGGIIADLALKRFDSLMNCIHMLLESACLCGRIVAKLALVWFPSIKRGGEPVTRNISQKA